MSILTYARYAQATTRGVENLAVILFVVSVMFVAAVRRVFCLFGCVLLSFVRKPSSAVDPTNRVYLF